MANALYDLGRQAFLEGSILWLTDDIKVALVDTALYTVNLATDQFLSSVSAGIVETSPNLTSKTSTAGVADAADVTFSSVTGAQSEALVIYKDTANPATDPLIAYIDTASAGLPVTPDGGDVTIQWDSGPNRIFKL